MLMWGMDEVVVSAGHVGGTHGSCIVSNAADVLWMIVVRGMRGFGEVCEMCMAQGGVCGSEWMRGMGLGFTNPVKTRGVLDVCLCLGCGGHWCGWRWAGGSDHGLDGLGGVMYV